MTRAKEKTSILVVAALGVVFGSIGSSPLYALKVCFTGHSSMTPSPQNVLGLVSLIFWSLLLVVSVKYAVFILKADDEGEGGVFAMLATLHKKMGARLGRGLIVAGLFVPPYSTAMAFSLLSSPSWRWRGSKSPLLGPSLWSSL